MFEIYIYPLALLRGFSDWTSNGATSWRQGRDRWVESTAFTTSAKSDTVPELVICPFLWFGDGSKPWYLLFTPSHSWVKMDVNNPLKIGIYRYWAICDLSIFFVLDGFRCFCFGIYQDFIKIWGSDWWFCRDKKPAFLSLLKPSATLGCYPEKYRWWMINAHFFWCVWMWLVIK